MEIHHPKLKAWIEAIEGLCQPDEVYYCDGSKEEYDAICQELVDKEVFVKLAKRPGSYWCRSDPGDVARVEDRTFI